MARKKVKIAYINSDSARRETFKKTRKGLMKKVSELSTLCAVIACAIFYGPYDRSPEVCPQQPEAYRVLMRFKILPEMDQRKKQLNLESFMYDCIRKIIEQFKKQQRENRYMEINEMYNHVVAGKYSISNVHPSDLSWVLEDKKKAFQRQLSELKKAPKSVLQTAPASTSSAIFTTPTTSDSNTTATPNTSTNTNVNVGGSNGVTMDGGIGMYGGVINHGTGGQERDQNNKNNNQMMVGGVSPLTIITPFWRYLQ
ncbi:hypothetical protein MKX03_032873 [Papaver bracteatum]|nr:hypothetical protein MKX03_032873 [Papaver bracteatum]